MAIEEKIEQDAYDAVSKVEAIPRPMQQERILKNIILGIMLKMNWHTVTTKEPEPPTER